jgi:4-hydroxybenzoyl-CoA thioesterase
MLVHRSELQIEWGDCDPFGIVFFPRYFAYFDQCTNALFHRALGIKKPELLTRYKIAGIPLVHASCNFLVASSFGDVVQVDSCVTEWGNSSFRLQHRLYRGDVLAVEGIEKRVWTVRSSDHPPKFTGAPIPEEVKARFA